MSKWYKHPAYIGYANDEDMKKDDRQDDWEKQFKEQGFDDSCTWSLDYTIVKFITPRLKRLIEIHESHIDAPDFIAECKEMLEGFEFYLDEDNFNEFNPEHMAKINKSFNILANNYRGLWW